MLAPNQTLQGLARTVVAAATPQGTELRRPAAKCYGTRRRLEIFLAPHQSRRTLRGTAPPPRSQPYTSASCATSPPQPYSRCIHSRPRAPRAASSPPPSAVIS